jgi:hypothetical protein
MIKMWQLLNINIPLDFLRSENVSSLIQVDQIAPVWMPENTNSGKQGQTRAFSTVKQLKSLDACLVEAM